MCPRGRVHHGRAHWRHVANTVEPFMSQCTFSVVTLTCTELVMYTINLLYAVTLGGAYYGDGASPIGLQGQVILICCNRY